MTLKTVNVSEETKKFLDAIANAMDYTQDRIVQMALCNFCPIDNWREMSSEELILAIAKLQSRRLRFIEDLALADKHGLTLSELGGYYPDLDGIRDYDEYERRFNELVAEGEIKLVKKKEESS